MRTRVLLAAATICASVAGCGPSKEEREAAAKAEAERAALAEFVEAGKETAAGRLRNPASAQFRGLATGTYNGQNVLCGEINGHNGFGAYAGFTPFMAVKTNDAYFAALSRDGRSLDNIRQCMSVLEDNNLSRDEKAVLLKGAGCTSSQMDFEFWYQFKERCASPQPYEEPEGEGR